MLSKLLIHPKLQPQKDEAQKLLLDLGVNPNHPDVLWVEGEEGNSLGIKEVAKVGEHLAFKPHSAQGLVVVIIGAENLSLDAQNSLLKTLEEPPQKATLILTASSEHNLLPTILSRCQIIHLRENLSTYNHPEGSEPLDLRGRVEQLMKLSLEKRFEIIEATEDKEALLGALESYVINKLPDDPKLLKFSKEVLRAQKYRSAQGNIRAILEYLMLSLPQV